MSSKCKKGPYNPWRKTETDMHGLSIENRRYIVYLYGMAQAGLTLVQEITSQEFVEKMQLELMDVTRKYDEKKLDEVLTAIEQVASYWCKPGER